MLKKYLTKVKNCLVKNCYEINKKLSKKINIYRKKLNSKCKITKNKLVNKNCAIKYYKHPENKEYRKTFKQYKKCNKQNCSKEFHELHKNYNFIDK